MSDPENFLSRWARLKREAAEAPEAAPSDAAANESSADAPAGEPTAAPAAEPTFDLAKLPPIESITATTDIRAFLAPGVPAELTRAALRRAWVADPSIRDFVGIAENQWDFNDPGAIPGFGPLGPLDDVRRLLAQVIGAPPGEAEASAEKSSSVARADSDSIAADSPESGATEGDLPPPQHAQEESKFSAIVQSNEIVAAMQDAESNQESRPPTDAPVRRTHGGALPK